MKEEINKLKNHCEKQIRLGKTFGDVKHSEEHKTVLNLINENERLQSQLKAKEDLIKEAREFINRDDICIDIRDNKLNYISTDVLDEILSKGENK